MAEGEEGSGGSLKASLTKKLGPLPVWVWAIAAAGVGYYLLRRYQSSSSATTTQQQPATAGQGQPADIQQIPVYLSSVPSTTSDTPAGTTTSSGQGNPNTPESNTFQQNLALGLVPMASPGQYNLPPGGGYQTLTYNLVPTPFGSIYTYGPGGPPGLAGTAAYFPSPVGPYQIASNNALAAMLGASSPPPPVNTNPGVNQPPLAPGQLSSSSYGYTPPAGGPSAGAAAALSGAGVTP